MKIVRSYGSKKVGRRSGWEVGEALSKYHRRGRMPVAPQFTSEGAKFYASLRVTGEVPGEESSGQ